MVELIKAQENFTLNIQLQAGSVPLTMVWIPPGDFVMGKNHIEFRRHNIESRDLPVWEFPAKISKGFWLSRFPVTCSQFKSINVQSSLDLCKGGNFPIVIKSWLDAMSFCQRLNIRYKSLLPSGYHFSLPTELQWEYASKAGQENECFSVDEYKKMYSGLGSREVGFYKYSNQWGLHDMLLNGPEICYDLAASPFSPEANGDEEEVYLLENGKVVDWVANPYPNSTLCLFEDDYFEWRISKGEYSSTYRCWVAGSLSMFAFRVSLRPIIDAHDCDLNDPWLKENGINILGE